MTTLDVESAYAHLRDSIAAVVPLAREGLSLVGVHSGGVWVAERLRGLLGLDEALGELNIAFYRDDFSRIGIHPTVEPSVLPFDVDGRDLVLVDDILYTGRTVRAALNELFDYGRPARVRLAVLLDRGGRELPIEAAFCGLSHPLPAQSAFVLARDEHGQFTLGIE